VGDAPLNTSAMSERQTPAFVDQRVSPGPRVTTRTVGGALVLLDAGTGQYFSLDLTGARAWTVLVSSASIAEAFETLLAEYQVEPAQLRADLEALIARLMAQGLIEVHRVG
jgi:hypothetical protein